MGTTFANISIKTGDVAAVKSALQDEPAFIASSPNWVTVYPEKLEELDPTISTDFAKNLSQKLSTSCIVLGVYDSDGLFYFYGKDGQLIDQYSDYPDDPIEGNPETLVELGPPGTTLEQISEVLDKEYTFAEEKYEDLVKVLGIDSAEPAGYGYIEATPDKYPNIKPL